MAKQDNAVSDSRRRQIDLWMSKNGLIPDDIDEAVSVAIDLLRAADIETARQILQRILEIRSNHSVALHYLGVAAFQTGRLDQAEKLIGKALRIEPNDFKALTNLGNVYRNQGRLNEAADLYRASLDISPNYRVAAQNLGVVLIDQGRLTKAIEILGTAVKENPENVDLCCTFVNAQIELGFHREALSVCRECSDQNPGHPKPLRIIARLLPMISDLAFNDTVENLLVRCFQHPEVESFGLRGLTERNLINCLPAAIDFSFGMTDKVSSPLLCAFLENEFTTHSGLEQIITNYRRQLLVNADKPEIGNSLDPSLIPLYLAIACQCHLNDFIFDETPEELGLVDQLIRKFTVELESKASIDIAVMAIIAAYRPLDIHPFANSLSSTLALIHENRGDKLVKWQITDKEIERKVKSELPTIGLVGGEVTKAVQSQYEESPYPRWHKINQVEANPYNTVMTTEIPALKDRSLNWPRDPKILVAGGGTGQQPITTAVSIANAEILAIDLSLSSLAYAKRMAAERNINNINFAQADLQTLGDLKERFDLIECSGVLHHLADPIAGWRVLTGILQESGFMKIALYSETARQDVVAARKLISEKKLQATPEGIRTCRRLLMDLPIDHPARRVVRYRDFFAMPECRDLLFHVQEHRFTIPQIQKALNELDLAFLGFTFGGQPVGKVTAGNSNRQNSMPDPSLLEDWHEYEQTNPDIFTSMYQFWVCKR